LQDHGVKIENPLNEKFDPSKHESISTSTTNKKNLDETIAEVIQKGYSLNGKIVRAPKVVVYEFK
jgi:molecular chaperone GrpE